MTGIDTIRKAINVHQAGGTGPMAISTLAERVDLTEAQIGEGLKALDRAGEILLTPEYGPGRHGMLKVTMGGTDNHLIFKA